MEYYLYSHSNTNGIFYIGKGCGDRVKHKFLTQRSEDWLEASKDGYTTKIEANGTNADISALEKLVIKSLVKQGVNLINKDFNPNYKKPPRTESHRQALSIAHKGKIKSKSHLKAISDGMRGKIQPHLQYFNVKKTQNAKLKKANAFGK